MQRILPALTLLLILAGLGYLFTRGSDEPKAPQVAAQPARPSAAKTTLPGPLAPPPGSGSTAGRKGAPTPSATQDAAAKEATPLPKISATPRPLPLDFSHGPYKRLPDGRILKLDVARRARTLANAFNASNASNISNAAEAAEEEVETVAGIVGDYRNIFRENPVAGTNEEVVDALTGNNAYDLVFIEPGNPAINELGELVDRWETPYRFHPVSAQVIEVSSAGPDRLFGTGDDIMLDEPIIIGDSGDTDPES